MAIIYNKDGIQVRDAYERDVNHIAAHMRESDVNEIWASNHHTPLQALNESIFNSTMAYTVLINDVPCAIWGVSSMSLIDRQGVVWLLATDALNVIQKRFLRRSKACVELMLSQYPFLYNFVDARNTKSIQWLKWIGADVHDAKPYGIEQLPFHYFTFSRSQPCAIQ